jgi:hypothetical protein
MDISNVVYVPYCGDCDAQLIDMPSFIEGHICDE